MYADIVEDLQNKEQIKNEVHELCTKIQEDMGHIIQSAHNYVHHLVPAVAPISEEQKGQLLVKADRFENQNIKIYEDVKEILGA